MANNPITTVTTGGMASSTWANALAVLNSYVGLNATSTPIVGTAPATTAPNFLIQAGQISGTTGAGGGMTGTFPVAFPNGLLAVVAIPSNGSSAGYMRESGASTLAYAFYNVFAPGGSSYNSSALTFSYIAIGF